MPCGAVVVTVTTFALQTSVVRAAAPVRIAVRSEAFVSSVLVFAAVVVPPTEIMAPVCCNVEGVGAATTATFTVTMGFVIWASRR
jgi:hypothetical protein